MALEKLPTELILQISDYLSPQNNFHFALTSQKLATILLPRARIVTLSYAADMKNRDLFLKVLEQDVDFNLTLSNRTILEECILTQEDEYVLPLLDRGVGLVSPPGSICAVTGINLLHLAASAGCGDAVLKRLLVHGDQIDPFAMDEDGITPLICAINERKLGAMKTLIDLYHERNREIDPPDSKCPLLLQAVPRGYGEIVLFLLQTKGVRVNARGPTGENALHWLTQTIMTGDECGDEYGDEYEDEDDEPEDINVTVLNALVAAGVSLSDTATEDRLTPLHGAAQYGRWDLIPHLVSAGADMSARCSLGGTPLHWAARGGSICTMDVFIELGASIHDTDSDNKTPLLWAYNCDISTTVSEFDPSPFPMMYLLEQGANISHLDASHQTILHLAAFHDRPNGVTELLGRGVDVNIQSTNGSTALHLAALNGSYKAAVQLLRAQPNLELRNTLGQTALDVAIENGREQIVNVIRKYIRRGVGAVGGTINAAVLEELHFRMQIQVDSYDWRE